jgi:hypothetical protein
MKKVFKDLSRSNESKKIDFFEESEIFGEEQKRSDESSHYSISRNWISWVFRKKVRKRKHMKKQVYVASCKIFPTRNKKLDILNSQNKAKEQKIEDKIVPHRFSNTNSLILPTKNRKAWSSSSWSFSNYTLKMLWSLPTFKSKIWSKYWYSFSETSRIIYNYESNYSLNSYEIYQFWKSDLNEYFIARNSFEYDIKPKNRSYRAPHKQLFDNSLDQQTTWSMPNILQMVYKNSDGMVFHCKNRTFIWKKRKNLKWMFIDLEVLEKDKDEIFNFFIESWLKIENEARDDQLRLSMCLALCQLGIYWPYESQKYILDYEMDIIHRELDSNPFKEDSEWRSNSWSDSIWLSQEQFESD